MMGAGGATQAPQTHRHPSLPSTQDEARRLAREGAPHATVVVADRQTAGRGQHGHAWESPPGGLYLSIVLRGVENPILVTLALGNAVAETLEVAGVDAKLKWVNDVLVGQKKVAGILVEAESTGNRIDFLVAGVGINVNGSAGALPAAIRSLATTVEDELGCESCIPDVETLLLETIQRWLGILRDEPARVVEGYRARDGLAGKRVRVDQRGGHISGTAAGIDDEGRLLLETEKGRQVVADGSVSVLA